MSVKIALQPNTLALTKAFAGFNVLLAKHLEAANLSTVIELVEASQSAQEWKNGTGVLENSETYYKTSAGYYEVGSNLPYAARRNWGFSGKSDSRNRYFANDPGKYFMETGLAQVTPEASSSYVNAVNMALQEMAMMGGLL